MVGGWAGEESECVMGTLCGDTVPTQCQFGTMRKSWRWLGGTAALHVNVHKATECALTNGRDGIFYEKHTKPR